jgi:tetratricopeptide (TPR) repeat protein
LWGSHYQRKADDVTQLQSDIARDVSNKLRVQLSSAQEQRLGRAGTNNPEAYRLYLEGRQLWYGRTPAGLKKSVDLFQQAIAADPNYALAYAGLADTYFVGPSYGIGISSKQGQLLGAEASQKAVQLDDSLSEAHAAQASALALELKWSESEAEFRRAIQLNPNNSAAHYFFAIAVLMPIGRINEALTEFQTALSLDPLSAIVNTNYGCAMMEAHRFPEALAQFQKVLARDPNFSPAHYKISQLYATMGRFPDAVADTQPAFPQVHASPDAKGYIELIQHFRPEDSDTASAIAVAYAAAGDREHAFQYLEKAYANGDDELFQALRYPALDFLRSDPRYKDIMRRLNLPE